MMKKISLIISSFALFTIPVLVYAQIPNNPNAGQLITGVQRIINTAIPLLFAIATLIFILYAIKYALSDDADKKKEARTGMISGIVALLVISTAWGLVGILVRTLGLSSGGGPGNIVCIKDRYGNC